MEKIDIAVTYLNDQDKKWQEEYNYWKEKEIKQGITTAKNRQAFGIERIRGWDAFKYWFRGVEKNCPWVNKVFLIVQNENHIPEWLNKEHPKLRIVYHDEYIDKNFLPTFNAMTIGMYISNIKDLSECYITSDDDCYFLNPIKEDTFFRGGKPVHLDNRIPYKYYSGKALTGTDNVFYQVLNNCLDFEKQFLKERVKYGFYHLQEARLKSFEKSILDSHKQEIDFHCSYSRFRHPKSLCSLVFVDLLKALDKAVLDNPYKNSCYCNLNSDVNFDEYKDKDMVCFNDTERLDDYEKTKEKLLKFLDSKLPDKCSFEKE